MNGKEAKDGPFLKKQYQQITYGTVSKNRIEWKKRFVGQVPGFKPFSGVPLLHKFK